MPRMFLALDLTTEQKQTIAQMVDQLDYSTGLKVIVPENYHLTLFFFGMIDENTQSSLCQHIDRFIVKSKPTSFNYKVNHIGLFERPKVAYLGLDSTPEALNLLASKMRNIAELLGFEEQHPEFTPHVSIFRKAKRDLLPKYQEKTVYLELNALSFSLYLSESTPSGPRYTRVKTWPLND